MLLPNYKGVLRAAWPKAVRGVSSVTWDGKARRRIDRLQADGYGDLPVCVAKMQYSFSTDATLRGAQTATTCTCARCGCRPARAAARIDLLDDGTIVGLS